MASHQELTQAHTRRQITSRAVIDGKNRVNELEKTKKSLLLDAERHRDQRKISGSEFIKYAHSQANAVHDVEAQLKEARKSLTNAIADEYQAEYHVDRLAADTSASHNKLLEDRNRKIQRLQRKQESAQKGISSERGVASKKLQEALEHAHNFADQISKSESQLKQQLESSIRAKKSFSEFRSRLSKDASLAKLAQEECTQAIREQRVNELLKLRHSTEESIVKINKERQDAKKLQSNRTLITSQRAKQLIESGQNPHEVLRREAVDQQYEQQQQQIRDRITDAKLRIVHQVAKEEEQSRHKERRNAESERRILDGARDRSKLPEHKVRSNRTSKYIEKHLSSGKNIIDAAGKSPTLYPSEHYYSKHKAPAVMGLGRLYKSNPELLTAMAAKYNTGIMPSHETNDSNLHTSNVSINPAANCLSKFERQMMDQARIRQKDTISQTQIVMGRSFTSAGFTPEPAVIQFKDYDPDQLGAMKLRFKLTNTSLSFNSFRLLPLSDDVRDLFDLQYQPPGRLSAGMSCYITVHFRPRIACDIDTEIPVLTSIGKMSVCLKANYRKCIPRLLTPEVRIGRVVRGETHLGSIRVTNDGAVEAELSCKVLSAKDSSVIAVPDGRLSPECFQVCVASSVGGYSECELPVQFTGPATDNTLNNAEDKGGDYVAVVCIEYSARVGEVNGTEQEYALIMAEASPVPMFVEHSTVDMKHCLLDSVYRQDIPIFNRGTVALKSRLSIPHQLATTGILQSHSSFGYVQPAIFGKKESTESSDLSTSGFTFSVKLEVSSEYFELVAEGEDTDIHSEGALKKSSHQHIQYNNRQISLDAPSEFQSVIEKVSLRCISDFVRPFFDESTQELRVPLRIVSEHQRLPIDLTLVATLAPNALVPSTTTVDFGACIVEHPVSRNIWIHNQSPFCTRFGVSSPLRTLCLDPGNGFGELLPFEKRKFDLIFLSRNASNSQETMRVESTNNRKFTLTCQAHAEAPKIRLGETKVVLPALAVGQETEFSISIENISDCSLDVNVVLSSLNTPPMSVFPKKISAFAPGDITVVAVQVYIPKDIEVDTIRRFASSIGFAAYTSTNAQSAAKFGTYDMSDCIACCVAGSIIPKRWDVSTHIVDFGQVSVGSSMVKTLTLINSQENSCSLPRFQLSGLSPVSAFSVLNASRAVYDSHEMKIQFLPVSATTYVDTLEVHELGSGLHTKVLLKGCSVAPAVDIIPQNGIVQCGPLLCGYSYYFEISICNRSQFAVDISVRCPSTYWLDDNSEDFHDSKFSVNDDGSTIVSHSPSSMCLKPGTTEIVEVCVNAHSFPSTQQTQELRARLRIDTIGQEDSSSCQYLNLSATCCVSPLYSRLVCESNPSNACGTRGIDKLGSFLDNFCWEDAYSILANIGCSPGDPIGNPIVLPQEASHRIVLGCVNMPETIQLEATQQVGTFKVILDDASRKLYSIYPDNGALTAGETCIVHMKKIIDENKPTIQHGTSHRDDGRLQLPLNGRLRGWVILSWDTTLLTRSPPRLVVPISGAYSMPLQPF